MTVFYGNPNSWRRALRATFIMAFIGACTTVVHAQTEDALSEQSATTPPYTLFEFSTLTSSSNTIVAARVPIVLTGKTIYKDVTLLFDVDSAGNLTLAPGYPKVVPSAYLIVANFKAGRYVGPSNVLNGNAVITVSGPGVTKGGATEWSLSAASGANPYTYPCSATWYVGPITSNPLYPRLKAAGITSTAWSYGVMGSAGCPAESSDWDPYTLIGLSQTGNKLTIVSFTSGGTSDHSTPQDQITYTLAP